MGGVFKVCIESIKQGGQRSKDLAEKTKSNTENVMDSLQNLEQNWEGKTKAEFQGVKKDYKTHSEKLKKDIEIVGNILMGGAVGSLGLSTKSEKLDKEVLPIPSYFDGASETPTGASPYVYDDPGTWSSAEETLGGIIDGLIPLPTKINPLRNLSLKKNNASEILEAANDFYFSVSDKANKVALFKNLMIQYEKDVEETDQNCANEFRKYFGEKRAQLGSDFSVSDIRNKWIEKVSKDKKIELLELYTDLEMKNYLSSLPDEQLRELVTSAEKNKKLLRRIINNVPVEKLPGLIDLLKDEALKADILQTMPTEFVKEELLKPDSPYINYFTDEQITAAAASIPATEFKAEWDKLSPEVKAKVDQSKLSDAPKTAMGEFGSPVPVGTKISSQFKASGKDYVEGMTHPGQDYSVGVGTPITANISGTVVGIVTGKVRDTTKRGFGNYVKIKDNEGNYHLYAHLSSVSVSVGDEVNVGDILGNSGDSGNTFGAHLHYEVQPDDIHWDDSETALNPNDFIKE